MLFEKLSSSSSLALDLERSYILGYLFRLLVCICHWMACVALMFQSLIFFVCLFPSNMGSHCFYKTNVKKKK
jgi:hypothetical protein